MATALSRVPSLTQVLEISKKLRLWESDKIFSYHKRAPSKNCQNPQNHFHFHPFLEFFFLPFLHFILEGGALFEWWVIDPGQIDCTSVVSFNPLSLHLALEEVATMVKGDLKIFPK